ncbi:unnamed protein product [Chrysoparadoxa australica]
MEVWEEAKGSSKKRKRKREVVYKHKWGEKGSSFKTGKFKASETHAITAAVEQYAAAHDVTVERLCQEGGHKGDLKGAWLHIADACPVSRTVQAIYRHAIRKMHNNKRGPWEEYELQALSQMVRELGPRWRKIEKRLGRSADACRDKYRAMSDGDSVVSGAWGEAEEVKLVKAVRKKTGSSASTPLAELPSSGIPWSEVAKEVGSRQRLACLSKWATIQSREAERLKYEADLKLVEAISETEADEESEVEWAQLGIPGANLRWRELKKRVPKSCVDLTSQVTHLIELLKVKVRKPAAAAAVTKSSSDSSSDSGSSSDSESESDSSSGII